MLGAFALPPFLHLHTINTERLHLSPNLLANSSSTFWHYSTASTINSPACQAHSLNQTSSLTRTRLLQRMPSMKKQLPPHPACVRRKHATSEPNLSIFSSTMLNVSKLCNRCLRGAGRLEAPASEAPGRFECGACRSRERKVHLAKDGEGAVCLD